MAENPYSSPLGEASVAAGVSGRSRLVPVAITLLTLSTLWIFMSLFGMSFFILAIVSPDTDPELRRFDVYCSGLMVIEMLYSCVLVTGGFSMIRRGSFTWAVVTSCLAMVPILSPFYFLGIPVGIWALVTLRKPAVRAAFKKL